MLYPGAIHRLLKWQFWTRTNAPWVLGVMHITANPSKPPASAAGEIGWRLTDPNAGNSATYFIDRDGTIWQALDPGFQVAWTNGDLSDPDTSHPAIQRILAENINANRACYFTAELVGNESNGYPINDAQVRSFAALLRFHAPHANLPINAATVMGHRHFNRTGRMNCPTSGNLEALLNRAITYATQEEDMPVLTRPVREKWRIPAATSFWTGGPEMGEQKVFTADVELWSNGETTDGLWRRVEYGSEELYIRRKAMTPIASTRNPATGYGAPTVTGYTQADLDAATASGTKTGFIDAKTKAVVAVQAIKP